MAGDDLDPRPQRRVLVQHAQAQRGACGPFAKAPQPTGLHHPQWPGVTRIESVESVGVDLAQVAGRMHTAGQHRQNPSGTGRARHRQRVEQVLRTVRRQGRCRTHRRDQHHRLGRRQNALQQPGGLLQCVGTVGDHQACHLGAGQMVGHATREKLPDRRAHVLAVDLSHLLGLDRGAGQRRHQGQQIGQQIQQRALRGGVADAVGGIG